MSRTAQSRILCILIDDAYGQKASASLLIHAVGCPSDAERKDNEVMGYNLTGEAREYQGTVIGVIRFCKGSRSRCRAFGTYSHEKRISVAKQLYIAYHYVATVRIVPS
jgi:hypothetical protein